jgi:hypothetical protein
VDFEQPADRSFSDPCRDQAIAWRDAPANRCVATLADQLGAEIVLFSVLQIKITGFHLNAISASPCSQP